MLKWRLLYCRSLETGEVRAVFDTFKVLSRTVSVIKSHACEGVLKAFSGR